MLSLREGRQICTGTYREGGLRVVGGLAAHRGQHLRGAMADVEDRDAAGEIHVAPSVRVPQLGVLRARGKDRHGGGQATRNRGLATLLQAGVVDHGGLLDWSQIATMWAKGVGPVFGGA